MSENNDSFEPIEKDSLNPVEQSQSAASDEVRNTNASTTDKKTVLSGMFRSWYLEYASYVILERAVPHIEDGLKPVQRRILHSMSTLDDGRFNKVANIVGNTMQYHPHGDASIGDALVQLGQRNCLSTPGQLGQHPYRRLRRRTTIYRGASFGVRHRDSFQSQNYRMDSFLRRSQERACHPSHEVSFASRSRSGGHCGGTVFQDTATQFQRNHRRCRGIPPTTVLSGYFRTFRPADCLTCRNITTAVAAAP